jgi:hypothetical protein
MDIFKGRNILEFSERFKNDLDCKEYLAFINNRTAYKRLKCNHNASQVTADFARQCTICSHKESAAANTLFIK